MQKENTSLQQRKFLATGLFILMTLVFIASSFWQKKHPSTWIEYVISFSEAAMIGALADWYAITALFKHPLGIPIPHTNIIEKSKNKFGENLGKFVENNFLSTGLIKKNINLLKIIDFIKRDEISANLIQKITGILNYILNQLNDNEVINFMNSQIRNLIQHLETPKYISQILDHFIQKEGYQTLITKTVSQIKAYISAHEEMIQQRVQSESYAFIPKFIDKNIAKKITSGIVNFLEEIENDKNHAVRNEITLHLQKFSEKLRNDADYQSKVRKQIQNLITEENLEPYLSELWKWMKASLKHEFIAENATFKQTIMKEISTFRRRIETDNDFKEKLETKLIQLIESNKNKISGFIKDAVNNWKPKELSILLEQEVGADLQFIRISGTLVGGLIGIGIHFFLSIIL